MTDKLVRKKLLEALINDSDESLELGPNDFPIEQRQALINELTCNNDGPNQSNLAQSINVSLKMAIEKDNANGTD